MIKKLLFSLCLLLSIFSFSSEFEGDYIFDASESESCPLFIEGDEVEVHLFSNLKNGALSFNLKYDRVEAKSVGHYLVKNTLLEEGIHYFSSCDPSGRSRVEVRRTDSSITLITSRLKESLSCRPKKKETTKRFLERVRISNGLLYLEFERAKSIRKNNFKFIGRCVFTPL